MVFWGGLGRFFGLDFWRPGDFFYYRRHGVDVVYVDGDGWHPAQFTLAFFSGDVAAVRGFAFAADDGVPVRAAHVWAHLMAVSSGRATGLFALVGGA